jgi:hypothetical protein
VWAVQESCHQDEGQQRSLQAEAHLASTLATLSVEVEARATAAAAAVVVVALRGAGYVVGMPVRACACLDGLASPLPAVVVAVGLDAVVVTAAALQSVVVWAAAVGSSAMVQCRAAAEAFDVETRARACERLRHSQSVAVTGLDHRCKGVHHRWGRGDWADHHPQSLQGERARSACAHPLSIRAQSLLVLVEIRNAVASV